MEKSDTSSDENVETESIGTDDGGSEKEHDVLEEKADREEKDIDKMQGVLEPDQEGDVEPAMEKSDTTSDENVETNEKGKDTESMDTDDTVEDSLEEDDKVELTEEVEEGEPDGVEDISVHTSDNEASTEGGAAMHKVVDNTQELKLQEKVKTQSGEFVRDSKLLNTEEKVSDILGYGKDAKVRK